MLRESPAAQAEAGAVETAARPDDAAQIAQVEQHWRVALATCVQDADFDRLLNFLQWLLDWWETVGPEDRVWLDGQLRRHRQDSAASQLPRPRAELVTARGVDQGKREARTALSARLPFVAGG